MNEEAVPLRIVQFVNTLDVADGGPARNSFELNLSLNAVPNVLANLIWMRGLENESVLATHSGTLPIPGPRRLSPRRKSGTNRQVAATDLLREIRAADCVIVHGYYLPWVPVVAIVAAVLRTPVTLMPHGALTARQQKASRAKKALYELSVGWFIRRNLSTFVTGSVSESEDIAHRFPNSASHVAGVGTTMREPAEFSAVHSPIRLVSLSRLAPKKRIDLMISALSILKKQKVDCRLTVAGTGDPALTRSLQSLATTLGVSDHVYFVGQLAGEAKHQLLWDSDIFLLPSDDENFGIALAEALAHGLPSVASAHVAASAAVRDCGGGRILSSQDANQLAEQIMNLALADDFVLERRQAFAAALRSYAWESVAATWVTELRRVSKSRRRSKLDNHC